MLGAYALTAAGPRGSTSDPLTAASHALAWNQKAPAGWVFRPTTDR